MEHGAHISGATTAVVLRYVERTFGRRAVDEMLRRAGEARSVEEISDLTSWSSYAQAAALFEAALDVTGDPDVARRIGEEMLRQHAGTEVAALLRSLGSPGEVLRNVAATGSKYSTVTEFDAPHVGETTATITTRTVGGFTRHPLLCDYVAGLLSQASALFGMDPAVVEETSCQRRGADRCTYDVRWNPDSAEDADPHRRVRHLEAQLAALSERFESLQATATELVTAADIETVLGRIARRAGLAVRAPGHVLAVRLPGESAVRVHAEGVAAADRDRVVADVLAADPAAAGSGRLVVDVASARHHYGRLAAVDAGASTFFAQERELLRAYAAQAAAALDTATALHEVTRRNDTARDLLRLSSALADVATRDEVAARLVAAVPGVIGCDNAAIFLWDPSTRSLTMRGSAGFPDEVAERLADVAISPAETPLLDGSPATLEPFVLDAEHPDAFARGLLDLARCAAAAVVPIVAGGEFFGIVTAGVHTDADRLRSGDHVLERLAGLAAQASSALRNADLLEEVSHRAMHDPLTGLPNRALLRDRLSNALAQAARTHARVGVLVVDLDGFKHVNDTQGHAVGDAVIVAAAERIASVVRRGDTVARLGGDEFAIVLPGIAGVEACRAVARKVVARFSHGLRAAGGEFAVTASVGAACASGQDTYDSVVTRADLAMYDAKHAGRNRFVVAGAALPSPA